MTSILALNYIYKVYGSLYEVLKNLLQKCLQLIAGVGRIPHKSHPIHDAAFKTSRAR